MQPKMEKQFRRLHMSVDDFERAAKFAREASKHRRHSIAQEGLGVAAIIYYARPFTENKSRKDRSPQSASTRLPKMFEKFDDPDDQKLHDRIMELRHSVVAHAEYGPGKYTVRVEPAIEGITATFSAPWRVANEWLNFLQFEHIAKQTAQRCRICMHGAMTR